MDELGDLRREYCGTPWRFIFATAVAGLMTIGGVWAIIEMKPSDPGKAWLVVLGFALITCVFTFVAMRDRATRLRVHEHGVVYARGAGERIARYADIAAVHEHRINGKPAALVLALRTGGELRISAQLDDYPQAAQAIANGVGR